MLKVIDPEQRSTTYTYTLRNELATETKQDDLNTARQYRYTYDPTGNLTSSRNPANELIEYRYDDANRLSETRILARADEGNLLKTVTYSYNNFNQYTGYQQLPGETPSPDVLPLSESYTYNALERLESVTVNFGAFQKTYGYTYYPNGLKKTYTNPKVSPTPTTTPSTINWPRS